MAEEKKTTSEEEEQKKADEFKKTSAWTRPRAMAKDRNVSAWLLLLGLLCLGVALWAPLSRMYWRMHNKAITASLPSDRRAECFVAISYEGVAAEPDPGSPLIPTATFRAHLEALKNAGYHPITLEDVRAFYYDNARLPEKAVLVTFENCHKSTYFETREMLAELRWHAVMGVLPKPVKENNQDVLLKPYLKGMVLDATWELADQSYLGPETIVASSHGREALFFSSPMWLKNEDRHEKFEEFTARIANDHTNSIAEFQSWFGIKPIAFFFPNGNYGQYEENNNILREANLKAVADQYDLGFILNMNALNDAGTDRRRINRLQVPAHWTAEQLLTRLDNSWPAEAGRSRTESTITPSRWIPDWGIFEEHRDAFTLRAEPATDPMKSDDGASGGARAWIAGSNSFRDGSFDIRFTLVRGELHAYLRFQADDCWLRVALTDAGRASVSQCRPGGDAKIIATDAVEDISDFRSAHSLLVTLRDDVLFVRLDGELLFGGAVLFESTPPGMVGVGIWAPPAGLARVDVSEAHLRSRVDALITWVPSLNRDIGYLMKHLGDTAFRYTIISPPWLDVYASSPITFPAIDSQALGIVALSNHNRVFPSLTLHDAEALASLNINEIVDHLIEDAAHGVFIDAADFPIDKLTVLKDWIGMLRAQLGKRRLGLAIRFPLAVANLSAIGSFVALMPDVLIVDDNAVVPPGIDPARSLMRIIVPPPATDEDMSLFYQLTDYNAREADALPETALYRKQGLKAYAEGRYADAADFWAKWQEKEPRNAEAWTFLGNAYTRLRETERAADAYGQSLALEPGQIQLMVERAKLLETAGRTEEAEALLDTYARAFPENADIAIAQALWLDRHGKREAGREILSSIITNSPSDIRSRLTLQGLLDDPRDRYRNMHELHDIGTRGNTQLLGFGHDIESAELLTIPESSVFFDFIRDTASHDDNESVRTLYSSFLPFTNSIAEKFDASRLSDNWIAFGTPLTYIAGTYDLKAASDMSEAYLRLKKSELMRDGFIEVTLGESVGAFWLYARRSSRSMIRFGFDGDGYIRIQTWYDGEVRSSDSVAWIRPAGDIKLRLEVRGDGAIGLIDGKQAFSTPLKIPEYIAYGWWSIAPFSPELGIARARIGRISAGPISPTVVLMRETDPEVIAAKLDKIRPYSRRISALSPVLFIQNSDGVVLSTPLVDLMQYRMFCSYHRIRFVPIVALDYYSDINPEMLVKIIVEHRLSGLVLMVRNMPHEDWFEKVTDLIEETTAELIVIQTENPIWPQKGEKAAKEAVVREVQRGSVLFQPNQQEWNVSLSELSTWKPNFNASSCIPLLVMLTNEVAAAEFNAAEGAGQTFGDDTGKTPPYAIGEKGPDATATELAQAKATAEEKPTDDAGKAEVAAQPEAAAPKATAEEAAAEKTGQPAATNIVTKIVNTVSKAVDTVVEAVSEPAKAEAGAK